MMSEYSVYLRTVSDICMEGMKGARASFSSDQMSWYILMVSSKVFLNPFPVSLRLTVRYEITSYGLLEKYWRYVPVMSAFPVLYLIPLRAM